MAVDTVFGRSGDVVALAADYVAFYVPLVAAVSPATKTKITYNANGQVTAGADATTADIPDSVDKRYVTEAHLAKLAATSGTNTGDQNLAPYALQVDLNTTNNNVAALSTSLSNYALATSLATTNTNVAANTSNFANYALLTDLTATNNNVTAIQNDLTANYTPLTTHNDLQTQVDTLTANLNTPSWLEGTGIQSKITFQNGLTESPINVVSNDLVTTAVGSRMFYGNSAPGAATPTFLLIAAEYLSNGCTGTGKVVLDTSPTFTTPLLAGPVNVKLSDTGTSTAPTAFSLEHEFTGGGSIVAGFGTALEFKARSTTTSARTQGIIRTVWTNATDGSRTANMVFSPVLNGLATDWLWLHGDGSMALGANAGSGSGVLWLQGGLQMPGVGTAGQVVRDNGGTLVVATLATTDLSGQFSSCGSAKATTTDQTSTAETIHLSLPVDANPVAGSTWRVTVWGNIDNGTTAVLFTPRLRWGVAGVILTPTPPTIQGTTTALTGKSWRFEFLVTITSAGAAGSARASWAKWEHTSQSSGANTSDCGDTGATDVTGINTTAGTSLNFTWAMDVNTGAPHVRTLGGTIELVRRYTGSSIT
jgi:hypothetical protein